MCIYSLIYIFGPEKKNIIENLFASERVSRKGYFFSKSLLSYPIGGVERELHVMKCDCERSGEGFDTFSIYIFIWLWSNCRKIEINENSIRFPFYCQNEGSNILPVHSCTSYTDNIRDIHTIFHIRGKEPLLLIWSGMLNRTLNIFETSFFPKHSIGWILIMPCHCPSGLY